MSLNGRHVGERALVLGGSMAGLFAGHVLAEHFREVLIADRDQLVGVTGLRRTTPQSFHAHALLARGQRAVEALFPGITRDFQTAGVPVGDVGSDLRWIVNGERLRPTRTGLVCLATPRITLENRVRERVRALPNVTFLEYTDVSGLVSTPDQSRVVGARIRRRAGAGAGGAADAAESETAAGHPGIDGPKSLKIRMASSYLPMVQRAAVHDEAVSNGFLRVAGLIDSPTALMRPARMMRVLRVLRRSARLPKAGANVEHIGQITQNR